MHYVSRLFDSPAEIREQNDVERWKLQCNLSLDQVIKIKFLKYKTKEAAVMGQGHGPLQLG